MMHRGYHHSVLDYTILALLLATCVFSFVKISGNADKQLQIGLITALSYALWGVFHHLHEGDLHWKIVLEYGALAILAFAMIWFLLTLS